MLKGLNGKDTKNPLGKLCNNKMVVVLCHYLQQDFSFLVFRLCEKPFVLEGNVMES